MNPVLVDVAYTGAFLAASPYFIYKMATTGKYRSGLTQRLGVLPARAGGDCIWVHGVSVGEVLAARGIVAGLETAFPGGEIAVSTTTNTGFEVALKNYPDKYLFYFPLDFSWAVGRAFRAVRPKAVVLMEMEVWPNFLHKASLLGVPVVVANGRITERAYGNYGRFRSLARTILGGVSLYLVQTETYAQRLIELGVPAERVKVTGSVKFDTLATDTDWERRARLRGEMGVGDGEVLLVGGSTHAGEEGALLETYRALKGGHPALRLLVVPRHRTRFEEVRALISGEGFGVFARSALAGGGRPKGGEVLLGDTMGELEALYEAADVAFVGGSLIRHGGQNILEPASKGKPVVFGPSMENFPDAMDLLLGEGAATQVRGEEQLGGAIEKYLEPSSAQKAGEAGRRSIIASKGATARTVGAIKEIIENN
ncbi:MAG: 3-deoxy-D-manno-octulosonic acid transferase [Planctomycetota bacterium]|jgi:3-deoxy-D-manno-octulosonic-acid transferase